MTLGTGVFMPSQGLGIPLFNPYFRTAGRARVHVAHGLGAIGRVENFHLEQLLGQVGAGASTP